MADKGTFRELIAWQKAIALAKLIYGATQELPTVERFRLMTQMRRAALSVACNIAEGNARQSLKDYIHFLAMARGSLAELETQLIVACEMDLMGGKDPLFAALYETRRVLQGLMDSLRRKQARDDA